MLPSDVRDVSPYNTLLQHAKSGPEQLESVGIEGD